MPVKASDVLWSIFSLSFSFLESRLIPFVVLAEKKNKIHAEINLNKAKLGYIFSYLGIKINILCYSLWTIFLIIFLLSHEK